MEKQAIVIVDVNGGYWATMSGYYFEDAAPAMEWMQKRLVKQAKKAKKKVDKSFG